MARPGARRAGWPGRCRWTWITFSMVICSRAEHDHPRRPMSVDLGAALDVDGLAGHVRRLVGGQPGYEVCDVVRLLDAAERDLGHRLLAQGAGRDAPTLGDLRVDL